MAQILIPPVPLGSDFESGPVQQWMELVRRFINQPPVFQSTVNPTTADIPDGTFLVWRNTALGQTRVWSNSGGVLTSVLLT